MAGGWGGVGRHGSWSHCIHGQEAERGGCWGSAHFLLRDFKMSDNRIMTPVARVIYPTQLLNSSQSRNSLRDMPRSLFRGDSRSCRVVSIKHRSSNLENGRSHSLLLGYSIGFCQKVLSCMSYDNQQQAWLLSAG